MQGDKKEQKPQREGQTRQRGGAREALVSKRFWDDGWPDQGWELRITESQNGRDWKGPLWVI